MSNRDETLHYYRARDPQAIDRVIDEYHEARKAWREMAEEFAADLGCGGEPVFLTNGEAAWLDHIRGAESTPPGWREYAKEPGIRPYRGGRDKASKEARAALKAINDESPGHLRAWLQKHTGAKTRVFRGFGMETLGGTQFLVYGQHWMEAPLEWDGNEWWEPVSEAEYHRAKADHLEQQGDEDAA